MEAMEAIFTRRSIRKYTAQPVPDIKIEAMLKAAMAAPSAGNQQPWQFVVIRERSVLDEIPRFHEYAQMIGEAPLAIVVCCDTRRLPHKHLWEQDCSAAMQNILLAAHAEGLGAVWISIHPTSKWVNALRDLLGAPEHVTPFSLVSVGYPAERKPPSERYDPSRVHYDGW